MTETWHGTVHSVVPRGVYVTIPRLMGREVLGPCLTAVPGLAPGDRVVGAKIGGQLADLIILCRATGPDYAPKVHTHTWGSITGRPATFDPSPHRHPWAELDEVPASFPPSAHTHPWAEVTDKPATFTPAAHEHFSTDVSDSTLVGRAVLTAADAAAARAAIGAGTSSLELGPGATDAMAGDRTFAYSDLTGSVPAEDLPPLVTSFEGRTGAITATKADVGLASVDDTADMDKPVSTATATALATKAPLEHRHPWADLDDVPATFAPSAHTHAWGDLTGLNSTVRPITYLNSWSDYSASFAKLKSVEASPGVILISGMPKGGTLTDGTAIGTLHADHWPTKDTVVTCNIRLTSSNVPGIAAIRAATGRVEVFGLQSTTVYVAFSATFIRDGS